MPENIPHRYFPVNGVYATGHMDAPPPLGNVAGMKLRVKEIRKAKGLTQEALASAIGLSQAQISRVESGDRNTTLSRLDEIAIALGCETMALFEDEDAQVAALAGIARALTPEQKRTLLDMAELFRARARQG